MDEQRTLSLSRTQVEAAEAACHLLADIYRGHWEAITEEIFGPFDSPLRKENNAPAFLPVAELVLCALSGAIFGDWNDFVEHDYFLTARFIGYSCMAALGKTQWQEWCQGNASTPGIVASGEDFEVSLNLLQRQVLYEASTVLYYVHRGTWSIVGAALQALPPDGLDFAKLGHARDVLKVLGGRCPITPIPDRATVAETIWRLCKPIDHEKEEG